MSPLDIVIIAVVAVVFALCVRHLAHDDGECSSCSSNGSCQAHITGQGSCPQTARMLADVDQALSREGKR